MKWRDCPTRRRAGFWKRRSSIRTDKKESNHKHVEEHEMGELIDRLARFSPEKRALIEKRSSEPAGTRTIPVTGNPWLAQAKPNAAARIRLFCVPFAGGDPSAFAGWHEGLPSWVEVCPILLPGRWTRLREPLFTDIFPLVRDLGGNLGPMLDKPFALFGHSTGALICFELARWLRKEYYVEPLHFFASACGAPQLPGRTGAIHTLSEPEFIYKMHTFQGIPEGVLEEPELREILLRILRADFHLTETYAYRSESPLACPITAFGGLPDPFVSLPSLEAWKEQTSGKFDAHIFPGGHMFLKAHKPLVLEAIKTELCDAQAEQRVTKTI